MPKNNPKIIFIEILVSPNTFLRKTLAYIIKKLYLFVTRQKAISVVTFVATVFCFFLTFFDQLGLIGTKKGRFVRFESRIVRFESEMSEKSCNFAADFEKMV